LSLHFFIPLANIERITSCVVTAVSAFSSDTYHALGKLGLFINFLGCNSLMGCLGALGFHIGFP
jgi:hypothetical protein